MSRFLGGLVLAALTAGCQSRRQGPTRACSARDGWFLLELHRHPAGGRLWGGCSQRAEVRLGGVDYLAQRHVFRVELELRAKASGRYGLRLDALSGPDPRFAASADSSQLVWAGGPWFPLGEARAGGSIRRTLRVLQPVVPADQVLVAGRLGELPSQAGLLLQPEDRLAGNPPRGWRPDSYGDGSTGWALVRCRGTSRALDFDLALPEAGDWGVWLRRASGIRLRLQPECRPSGGSAGSGPWREELRCPLRSGQVGLRVVCGRTGRLDAIAVSRRGPPRPLVLDGSKAARMFPRFLRHLLARVRTRVLDQVAGPAEWLQAARRIRDGLRRAMDLPAPGAEPTAVSRGRVDKGRYFLEKLWIRTVDGLWTSALAYRPKRPGRAPVVLHLLGHYGQGTGLYQARRLGACLAGHGIAVLAADNLSFANRRLGGRHRREDHHFMGWWHLLAGSSPARVIYGEPVRLLDFLGRQDWVDTERIGVTGSSGGGTASLYLAALDERVSAAAVLAAVSTWDHFGGFVGGDPEQFPKGLVTLADFSTLLALVAPRPLLVAAGRRDDLFPAPQAARAVARARRAWRLLGAGANLAFAGDRDSHGLKPARVEAAIRFFLRAWGLRVPATGPVCGDVTVPSPKEVRVPDPPRMSTFLDSARGALARHAGKAPKLDTFLRKLLGLPPAGAPGSTAPLRVLPPGARDLPGRAVVLRLGAIRSLPGVLAEPRGRRVGVVLFVADGGHREAVLTPLLLAHGLVVLSVDLSGLGELTPTRRARYGLRRDFRRVHRVRYLEGFFPQAYLVAAGDSLPALRTRELLAAADALRARYPGLPLGLVVQGPLSGFYGLLAAAATADFEALFVFQGPRSLRRDLEEALFPLPGQALPGLLSVADVEDLYRAGQVKVAAWFGCRDGSGRFAAWRPAGRRGEVRVGGDAGVAQAVERWIEAWLRVSLEGKEKASKRVSAGRHP